MFDRQRIACTSKELAAFVALGIMTAAAAGCYGPPHCDDFSTKQRTVSASGGVSLGDGGSFSVAGRGHFDSCNTFCAVEPGVESVNSCKPPERRGAGWVITCDVQATECRSEELIGIPGKGRLPEGFSPEGGRGDTLGDYFAMAAQLEAVSVPAFHRLARELAAHHAPVSLVRAARSAARDEVKHTRMMQSLARRHGVEPMLPRIGALAVRGLEAIAIENAIEGCVGETMGAIVATAQAARAEDRSTRRAMAIVARDETEHAILAWRVHAFCMTQLGGAAQARVREALLEATHAMEAGTVAVQSPSVQRRAGLPELATAKAMIAAARESLWSAC